MLSLTMAAQETNQSFFNYLNGKTFVGHYSDQETAFISHKISWETKLEGKLVHMIKTAPEVNFEMEAWFYTDQPDGDNSFLMINNKNSILKGTYKIEKGILWLEGRVYEDNKIIQVFRQSFKVNEQGKLVDKFYRLKNEEFIMGHEILYSVVE